MANKRLSSKEYQELLQIMRRWPDPYRKEAAKLVHHIAFQFTDIKKLEEEVRYLRQKSFEYDKTKLVEKKVTESVPKSPIHMEKWPLGRRLADIKSRNAKPEWDRTLKWNKLSENDANRLISEYENKVDST